MEAENQEEKYNGSKRKGGKQQHWFTKNVNNSKHIKKTLKVAVTPLPRLPSRPWQMCLETDPLGASRVCRVAVVIGFLVILRAQNTAGVEQRREQKKTDVTRALETEGLYWGPPTG